MVKVMRTRHYNEIPMHYITLAMAAHPHSVNESVPVNPLL